MSSLLWFSSPPTSPIKEIPDDETNHGVIPVASVEEKGKGVVSQPQAHELKWVLDKNGASEAMTFYISFEDGSFSYVQFAYSTVGLSPTAQVTVRYWLSDEIEFTSTNSFSGSSFILSSDRCSCTLSNFNKLVINSSLTDKPSYNVSAFPRDKKTGIQFTFESISPIVQIKSGKTLMKMPSVGSQPFFVCHKFIPIGAVNATVVNGNKYSKQISGHATYLYGMQSTKPHLISTRWDMFQLLDPSTHSALLLLQFKTPAHFSKQAITQSMYIEDAKVVCCSTKAYARHVSSEVEIESGYPVPKEIEYRWFGQTIDGEDFLASGDIKSTKMISKWDILSTLPFLLRKLLQTLIAKPYTFLWWDTGSVVIEKGGSKKEIRGRVFHETTYVNLDK